MSLCSILRAQADTSPFEVRRWTRVRSYDSSGSSDDDDDSDNEIAG